MKRFLSLLCALTMLLCMTACVSSTPTKEDADESTVSSQTESVAESKVESKEEVVSQEEKVAKIWAKSYYVDEFDQPTDEWYICNSTRFLGKFSNSATTDSNLAADIAVDASGVSIFLYEYAGNNPVKNYHSNAVTYTIKVKDKAGNVYDMTGRIFGGSGDRVRIDDGYKAQFIQLLKGEGTLSIYLVNDKYTTSTYLFSAVTGNFKDIYE